MFKYEWSEDQKRGISIPRCSSSGKLSCRITMNTAFKQQHLSACQPMCNANAVLSLFSLCGIAFLLIGSVLLHVSNNTSELIIDYTDCVSSSAMSVSSSSSLNSRNRALKTCSSIVKHGRARCHCSVRFHLNSDFQAPVNLYYGLVDFYQNHRRYVISRDDNQLRGDALTHVSATCAPFDHTNETGTHTMYAPCGAIANSLFNDSFALFALNGNGDSRIPPRPIPVSTVDIALPCQKRLLFGNPGSWRDTRAPRDWPRAVYNMTGSSSSRRNSLGYQYEPLMVWMRTAAFPTFRKLYGRVYGFTPPLSASAVLPKGNYSLEIEYNFPVGRLPSRKSFVMRTTTWLGGKNPFLAKAYLIVGAISLLFVVLIWFESFLKQQREKCCSI